MAVVGEGGGVSVQGSCRGTWWGRRGATKNKELMREKIGEEKNDPPEKKKKRRRRRKRDVVAGP